jgi:zinc protease
MLRRLVPSAATTAAAVAACAFGAMSLLSAQGVEAPRPAPAQPAPVRSAPASTATQPAPAAKPVSASRPAARPATAPAASAAPKVAFEKHVLPNGLQLILHVDRKLPIVHVNQWFHVGSKNEVPGRTGFAHLFEHLMFQGSTHVPGEYFSLIEKMGANIREGGVNGTTSGDRTNYFATVPSANLEALLWVESDRLATLLDQTDQKKLDNQRDVVKNERRQGIDDPPYGRAYELLVTNSAPAGHPYSWPGIGSMEDLSAASLDDVKAFFRRYYTPNNLSLVIAGDFDPAEAKRLVEKYFGGLAPGPALDRPRRWIPELEGERVVEVNDRVPAARTYVAYIAPEYFGADEAAMQIAARILGDGLSSRLEKALIYDKPLASEVNVGYDAQEIAGGFVVVATARDNVALPDLEQVITRELQVLARTGPTQAELDRARTKQEFQFISGLERIGGFGGKADLLNQYNTFLGDPGKFEADLGRYRALTVADVRNAAQRWLATPNRLIVRFHPEASGRSPATTLDRSKQPPFGADRAFAAPAVQTATLENGLQIHVVERDDLPKVAVSFATRAGAIADPAGAPGTAAMTLRTIDLGTKTRSALAIESALGDLGVTLDGGVQREISTVGFEVLTRNLGPAFAILADVVQRPTFPASEVEREKKRQIDGLLQGEKDPGSIAARLRGILAFGVDHPYGWPAQGFVRTIEPLTRQQLADFHAARFRPGSSTIIFVGQISLKDATALARQHFGAWTGGAAAAISLPAPKPAPAGRFYVHDRQDAAQTMIMQFLPAPKRAIADYTPLVMADAVWGGGGFGTRLNLNLREAKGYSYGVFSTLVLMREAGIWYAAGPVQTDKTSESVAEFDKELKAIAGEKAISEDEFASAKLTKVRGFAQTFESYSRVGDQIERLWALGLPMSELQGEYDEAAKATLPAAMAAAKLHARPDRASTILVGDRAKIEGKVRDLKVGDIVVVDAEGRPVSGGATATPASSAR